MNAENFVYWLQGFLELREDDKPLSPKQVQIIKDHLALVFTKVTPDRKDDPAKEEEPDVWPSIDFDPFDRPDVYCAPATTVAPPIQPTVLPSKTNIEEIVKKIQEKQFEEQKNIRVTCTTEPSKKGVEYWSGRSGVNFDRPGNRRIC